MTSFWMSLLRNGMPVVIDVASNLSKSILSRRRSARQYELQAKSSSVGVDVQAEKLEALQAAVIRVATEVESLRVKEAQVSRAGTQLRWASVVAFLLSLLALIIVFLK